MVKKWRGVDRVNLKLQKDSSTRGLPLRKKKEKNRFSRLGKQRMSGKKKRNAARLQIPYHLADWGDKGKRKKRQRARRP